MKVEGPKIKAQAALFNSRAHIDSVPGLGLFIAKMAPLTGLHCGRGRNSFVREVHHATTTKAS